MALGLAISPVFDPEFKFLGGTHTMAVAVAGLVWNPAWGMRGAPLRRYDYNTTLFLASVFIVVGGLEKSGLIHDFASYVAGLSAGEPYVLFLLVVCASVAISAFVCNVPYITAMIPV